MWSWEFFSVIGFFLLIPQDLKSNVPALSSLNAFSVLDLSINILTPIALLIALLAIEYWRRWGVYLFFVTFGSLFIKGILGFLFSANYLEFSVGLPTFITLSVLNSGLMFWAIKRKWSQFV